jgi:hypothetical protein
MIQAAQYDSGVTDTWTPINKHRVEGKENSAIYEDYQVKTGKSESK